MDKAEFDRFADEYYLQHAKNISLSGESPDFFAEYKVADAAAFAESSQSIVNNVLDFGSGIGNSVPFFRRHFASADLICADVSRRSIDISELRFPGAANYVQINDDRLPLQDNVIDLAFTACVFHHIPLAEHGHWLRELLRVTRKGGMLVLFEHNPWNPLTVRAVNTCPFDINAKLIGAADLVDEVMGAGWRQASARYRIFFPRALSFARPLERYLTWLPLGAQYCVVAHKD